MLARCRSQSVLLRQTSLVYVVHPNLRRRGRRLVHPSLRWQVLLLPVASPNPQVDCLEAQVDCLEALVVCLEPVDCREGWADFPRQSEFQVESMHQLQVQLQVQLADLEGVEPRLTCRVVVFELALVRLASVCLVPMCLRPNLCSLIQV